MLPIAGDRKPLIPYLVSNFRLFKRRNARHFNKRSVLLPACLLFGIIFVFYSSSLDSKPSSRSPTLLDTGAVGQEDPDIADDSDDAKRKSNTESKSTLAESVPQPVVIQAPSVEKKSVEDQVTAQRRDAVKQAMTHAWRGYEKYAWGFDELRPVSNGAANWLGLGATIVDALDTLWMMDMKDEFKRARDWVEASLDFDKNIEVSVFETNIRVLGGLLSAHDFSGDLMFIKKAKELADRLIHAFNSPSGVPYGLLNLQTFRTSAASWTGMSAVLAECGTLQMEFKDLSYHLGDPKYGEKADHVIKILEKQKPANGLYPLFIDPGSGSFTTGSISFGALGDSFYEYLVKVPVMTGNDPSTAFYRKMYDDSIDGMASLLVHKSNPSGYSYVAEWNGGRAVHKMDELACFVPGMLALGSKASPKGERDLTMAKEIMETCYKMWEAQPSGIAPENVFFRSGADFSNGANYYLLRPETTESLFYLWRATKDPKYRDYGWKLFEAIEKQCKTESGYSGLREVSDPHPSKDDSMQSFFLAETLKYFWLLYSDDDALDLEKWVFNTEAHPIKVWDKTTNPPGTAASLANAAPPPAGGAPAAA